MPGHRHASHSRRSRSRSRSSRYSRHSRSSCRSRRTPSPAASTYSSSDRSLSPPAVEAKCLRRRLLRDRQEDKTAKATRAKEETAEPQSGKGLGVMCTYPGCTAPVMYTQSFKNHMIKTHLKTTSETYMKQHRDSYEVAVDSPVLLNDADNAKRMLMFRIGNIERSLDRLTQRFETEMEAKMEVVMAPLLSELYQRLSKRLDARPRSQSRSRSPPPRSRTPAKRRYDYDDHHSSSPKVPRHSRSASVRTVFEAAEDTSMEVVDEEENKAPVPTAAAEQLVQMATSTPAATSASAPAAKSTSKPAPPASVQTPMPAAPAAPVQTPMPAAPTAPAASAHAAKPTPAPAVESESEEDEEEETQLLEPAPTSKPGPHRTKKQSAASRANGVKARRNNKIKGAGSQVKVNRTTKLRDQVEAKLKAAKVQLAATVATLASASDAEQAAIEKEIAKLEAEVQKRTQDLKAIKLDLALKGAASIAHKAVMFGKDVGHARKDKENALKAATKKANAKQSSAKRAAAKTAMEIAASEYEAFDRIANQVEDAVEAVAAPVAEAIEADQLTKAIVEKALDAALAFDAFYTHFDRALLKLPQTPAQSEDAAQDLEL